VTSAELQEAIERSDAQTVLGTPEGRRWVWALLESCDVWGEAPVDPIEQNRHAGRRDVGIAVMRRLQRLLPGEYNLMVQEAAKAAAEAEMRRQLETTAKR